VARVVRRAARLRRAGRALAVAAAALFVALVAGLLPVEVVRVEAASMAPTLRDGERVVLVHGVGEPRRGELVALDDPAGGGLIVKRVVALAGDRVEFDDGRLVLDGRVVDEPYADLRHVDGVFAGPFAPVPPGHVYVLGDNRGDSVDSRTFGPVPVAALDGRITARLWPPAFTR
jgi:signal peptidase I